MNWLQLQWQLFQHRVNWQFAQWLHKKFSNPAELSPHPDYGGNHFFPFRSGSQFQFSIPVPSCATTEKGNIFHVSLATLAPLPEAHTPEAAGQLLFYTFLIRFLPADVWLLGVWLPGVQSCKSRMKFIEYLSKKKYIYISLATVIGIFLVRVIPVGHMCSFWAFEYFFGDSYVRLIQWPIQWQCMA